MNESQAKVSRHINDRDRIHDFIHMCQERSMTDSIAQKHELCKVSRNQIESSIHRRKRQT